MAILIFFKKDDTHLPHRRYPQVLFSWNGYHFLVFNLGISEIVTNFVSIKVSYD